MSVNADVRRAVPSLTFNGTNVDTKLAAYLESVSYTDVASGSSDSIDIQVQNIDFKWLESWYPTKGDKIKGNIKFKNWKSAGSDLKLSCGTFILDEISFTGGPLRLKMSALSTPADESFKSRERTQTWKKVTIQQIAQTIASRYSLSLSYSGASITIDALEQSDETDSAFLYSLCEDYGLSMKVYNEKLVIYDQTTKETEGAIAVLRRKSFVDDEWTYTDALVGTYTGARISYKRASDDKEISIYLGLTGENASGSRTLKINETVSSLSEARYKAAAQVNKSNESATTITGSIWPNPKICAGVCIRVKDMGQANGKYFVDKSTTTVDENGTTQQVELHKCQTRLSP